MKAIVVYESLFGNTHAIAEAVAEGLGGVPVPSVREAVEHNGDLDLLVVRGPTHAHGLATDRSRQLAVDNPHESADVEPDATEEPGLRSWLGDLRSTTGRPAAAFDTRADGVPLLTGSAARGIARRLRHHGFDVLATESFLGKAPRDRSSQASWSGRGRGAKRSSTRCLRPPRYPRHPRDPSTPGSASRQKRGARFTGGRPARTGRVLHRSS
jgi:hypothetical protein